MSTTTYARSIEIHQTLEKISNFIDKTVNLTRWTHFFKKILQQENNICQFDTPLGTSITSVHKSATDNTIEFKISSHFVAHNKNEFAIINVKPEQTCANVEFKINLPAFFTSEQIDKQLNQLEAELVTLKKLLEEDL